MSASHRSSSSAAPAPRPANRRTPDATEAARQRAVDPVHRVEVDRRRGRGAVTNPGGRYETVRRELFDDGWDIEEEVFSLPTEVILEKARTIITKNDSPDLLFERSINPYRGCEHGCSYCFARP